MHNFLVCKYKYPDFEQNQENFAQLHNCEIVTSRNCALFIVLCSVHYSLYCYDQVEILVITDRISILVLNPQLLDQLYSLEPVQKEYILCIFGNLFK